MALDLKALRAKLGKLNGAGKSPQGLFKPEEGENRIRIVPLQSDPSNPFQELLFHFNLLGKTWLSPLSYGERDPLAEFSDSLIAEGQNKLSKEEYKAAKQFYPQLRTYLPIVVRGKEAEGVQFWAFGKTVLTDLLGILSDEDYGDITDPKNGRDLKIVYTASKGNTMATTNVMVSPKQSPLTDDKALLNKLLNEQPVLLDIAGQRHTYEELHAALARALSPQASAAPSGFQSSSSSDASWDEAPVTTKEASSSKVDEQFEELFGK